MKILSIETSCDETALALIEVKTPKESPKNPQFTVLATSLFSQIEIHKEYGGVFPALAKRAHSENILPLMSNLLSDYFTHPDASDLTKQSSVISLEQEGHINTILERDPELAKALIEFIEKTPSQTSTISSLLQDQDLNLLFGLVLPWLKPSESPGKLPSLPLITWKDILPLFSYKKALLLRCSSLLSLSCCLVDILKWSLSKLGEV